MQINDLDEEFPVLGASQVIQTKRSRRENMYKSNNKANKQQPAAHSENSQVNLLNCINQQHANQTLQSSAALSICPLDARITEHRCKSFTNVRSYLHTTSHQIYNHLVWYFSLCHFKNSEHFRRVTDTDGYVDINVLIQFPRMASLGAQFMDVYKVSKTVKMLNFVGTIRNIAYFMYKHAENTIYIKRNDYNSETVNSNVSFVYDDEQFPLDHWWVKQQPPTPIIPNEANLGNNTTLTVLDEYLKLKQPKFHKKYHFCDVEESKIIVFDVEPTDKDVKTILHTKASQLSEFDFPRNGEIGRLQKRIKNTFHQFRKVQIRRNRSINRQQPQALTENRASFNFNMLEDGEMQFPLIAYQILKYNSDIVVNRYNGNNNEVNEINLTIRTYISLRKEAKRDRMNLGAGNSELMNQLYHFWSYFLRHHTQNQMYKDFIYFASDDNERGSRGGLRCLYNMYELKLSDVDTFKSTEFSDFQRLLLKDKENGIISGLAVLNALITRADFPLPEVDENLTLQRL